MFKQSPAEKALHSAEIIVADTQRAASGALSGMAHALDHGVDRAREASSHLRDSAQRMGSDTAAAIRHDPVKSVLIAAATGAALMALLGLLTRSTGRH
jgi:ElaB/YqjD/DUF883 family membrane-anchored ribosome-binding protein